DIDLGKCLQKRDRHRQHVQAPEHDGRRDDEAAARCAVFAGNLALGLGHGLENAPARRDVGTAGIGQRDATAGAVDQPRAEVRLEVRHLPADGRERHAKPARRRRQAAGVNHREQRGHGFEAVHRACRKMEGWFQKLAQARHCWKATFGVQEEENDMSTACSSDVAFTPSVKAIQTRKGSRDHFGRMEERGGWQTRITPELGEFIAAQSSVYLATASADGQPYIQHRGGPPGFLHVRDDKTIAFADFAGNRQYITQGNLAENPKAYLFLMDYAPRKRVKIWGTARVVEGDAALTAELMPAGYKARPEQVILFTVAAWDTNCPQHIPQLIDAARVAAALSERDRYIAALEAEVTRLRAVAADSLP